MFFKKIKISFTLTQSLKIKKKQIVLEIFNFVLEFC